MLKNTKYEDTFINTMELPWLPWIGSNFDESNSRTMILGESTYNWDPNDPYVAERISKNDHLRILHKNHAINTERNSSYVRNIERAIFQAKKPSKEDKLNFWTSVAYHNLVLRHMPTLKDRPTYNDYKRGWEKYLLLIDVLNLKESVVYGLESKKYNSLIDTLKVQNITYEYKKLKTKVGNSYPRVIEIKNISHKMIFIRHPSSFFSWKKWGKILKENLAIDIINKE